MYFRIRSLVVFVVAALALPNPSMASVVFEPGKKAKFVAPGDEEISGDAAEMFQIGQTAEKEGNTKRAIRAYKTLVKRHPKDTLAAGALFRAGELQEQRRDYLQAAQSRIGEIYLAGKKLKILGIPIASSLDRAVTIFADVVRTAPYGKYTARAQFDIGLAR